MRRNSVRHFVHMVIDILPLLIIPIFAININQKSVEPLSVTTSGYEIISLYETNEINTENDIQINKLYHTNLLEFNTANLENIDTFEISVLRTEGLDIFGQYVMDEFVVNDYNANIYNEIKVICTSSDMTIYFTNGNAYQSIYLNQINFDLGATFNNVDFVIKSNVSEFLIYLEDSGNDLPTSSNYKIYETAYSEGIVLNNTDIGSQFLYSLYIPVHDYFNFNNLFNMGAIYDWIQLNLFNGTAPLPVFIIWNIIVYEFFVDLIFLFYGVFMFIIDFAEKCLERPFGR